MAALSGGHRCGPTDLAESIEYGAAQLSLTLLTIGSFCAQMSSDNSLVPMKWVLYMSLSVVARCPPPLEDALRLDVGDVLVSLCRLALGGR